MIVEYPGQLEVFKVAPLTSVENEVIYRETVANLQSLCRELPESYRHAFTGYYFDGKSYRELADEAGVTVKTVESRLYRARKILREKLKGG